MKRILYASLLLACVCILPSCKKGNGCGSPSGSTTTNINLSSAILRWNTVSGAQSYNVQYRVKGTSTWTPDILLTADSVQITGLNPGTTYEWQVQTLCNNGLSGYTGSITFATPASNIFTATFKGVTHTFVSSGGLIGYTSGNYTQAYGIESSTNDTIAVVVPSLSGGTSTFAGGDIAAVVINGAIYETGAASTGNVTMVIDNRTGGNTSYGYLNFASTTLYNMNNASDSAVITNCAFAGKYTLQ